MPTKLVIEREGNYTKVSGDACCGKTWYAKALAAKAALEGQAVIVIHTYGEYDSLDSPHIATMTEVDDAALLRSDAQLYIFDNMAELGERALTVSLLLARQGKNVVVVAQK